MKSIFALFAFAACSTNNPLDPGAGNNVGSGTGTLLVTGSALATPNITDGQNAADFTTDFTVHVSIGNRCPSRRAPSHDPPVRQRPADLQLGPIANLGEWQGSANGYDEVYELDVSSGTDGISGVIVDGPDIHVITGPTAGATIDSTMAFDTTWSRHAGAEEARIAFTNGGGGGDGIVIPDTGTYSVTAGSLKTDKQQPQPNTIRLTRTNNVIPAGAVVGSMLTVGVVNQLDVVAAPCPTCN